MKSISLYELTTDLIELIDIEDVEMNEELKSQVIEQIEAAIEDKSGNMIAVIKNYEATIGAIKLEEKRLSDNRKVIEKKVDRLKGYIKECLEKTGKKKVETTLGNLSLRKLPGSVEIIDETKLMNEPIYVVEKVTRSLDKKAILADLKEGLVVDGAILKTGTSLTIK
ncbi:MAG: siphovirus Gp157 family protein [Paraclostridium sp.]